MPAGRRSGKTELAKRHAVLSAIDLAMAYGPDSWVVLTAPTHQQAKRIYWRDIKSLIPYRFMAGRPSESELTVRLATGVEVSVVGLDVPERIEGRPLNGIVLDEFANMHESVWGEHVYPALADTRGWAWFIGVPEGRNHYYDLYCEARADDTGEWDAFHWLSADILDAEAIASAKRHLDPLVYQQEFEASFVTFAGLVYYNYSPDRNLAKLEYDPARDLILCFDFNKAPGTATVVQENPGPDTDKLRHGTNCIGEVHIPQNSTTPMVCRRLVKDWGHHEGNFYCYGDATGGAGGSAAVEGPDWELVRKELVAAWGSTRVRFRVPRSNPSERSRVNSMNCRLLAGDGTVSLWVDPRKCPHLVKDLEGVRTVEGGTGEIDKKRDLKLTHSTDEVGYYVEKEFPVRGKALLEVEQMW